MIKKFACMFLCFLLVSTAFTGCGKKEDNRVEDTSKGSDKKQTVIDVLQYSPEYTNALRQMAEEYNKQFPDVKIDFVINQDNYKTVLKTRINAGEIPDVFMTGAYNENDVYKDYCYDLSNESFMDAIVDSAKTGVTVDGKILGFPFVLQGYSFIYNKALFEKAGITEIPKTYDELKKVCEQLNDKGITPFATGFKEWWVFEQTFTECLSKADIDHEAFAEAIGKGEKKFSDVPEAMRVFDIIDTQLKYSLPKPFENDFNAQVTAFATGKVAMIHQGTWAESAIRKITPDIDMGFLPGPVTDDPSKAGIMADSNIVYRVYKDSEDLQEVLNWLHWLVTSDYGKAFQPTMLQEISTNKEASFPDAQLAQVVGEHVKNGTTYAWVKGYWPDGYEEQLGKILQDYAAGGRTREEAVKALEETYQNLYQAK